MKTHGIALLVLALAGCASHRSTSSNSGGQASVESAFKLEVVPLKYATAREVADSLSKLLSDGGRAASASARYGDDESEQPPEPIQIVADQRTNSLVIRCPADRMNEMPEILATISKLDREVTKS